MSIHVGNLSLDVIERDLWQEFMTFGAVVPVVIMNDKYIGGGQGKGYGFVEMASKSEGEAAITGLNGKKIKSLAIDVAEALPLSDKRDAVLLHGRINS